MIPFESSQFVHSDGGEYGHDEEFGCMWNNLNEPSIVEDSVSMLELHYENPSYIHDSLGKRVLSKTPSGLSLCVQSNGAQYGHEFYYFHDQVKDGNYKEEGHNNCNMR